MKDIILVIEYSLYYNAFMNKATPSFKIIFTIFFLFYLFNLSKFGLTWDEPVQHHLGRANLDYLLNKTENIDLERGDLIFYGPGFEILNQITGQSLRNSLGLEYSDAFHLLPLILVFLGIFFLYKLIRELFNNDNLAIISSVILLLSPRFMAHAFFNSKDAPLAALCIIIFYFWVVGLNHNRWKMIMFGWLIWGFALSLRVDAVLIPVIFFLAYLLQFSYDFKLKKPKFLLDFKLFAFTAPSFLITLFAFWPILWTKPQTLWLSVEYFLNHSWPGDVLYFGQIFTGNTVPWHYGVFYVFLTLPVIALAFSLFGMIISFWKIIKFKQIFQNSLLFFWLIIPIAISFKSGVIKYDGVRHFLISLPALIVFAGIGMLSIVNIIHKHWPNYSKNITSGFIILALGSLLYQNYLIFPYGDSYYNEIVQKTYNQHLEKSFEIEYWGATLREGVKWLNAHANQKSTVCVPFAEHLIEAYPLRQDLTFTCGKETNYLMFFTRVTYIPHDLNGTFKYEQLEPVFTINRLNSDLLYVYELK